MKEDLQKFLKENRIIQLATYDENHPWICNLYSVVDKDLHFYFLSDPETLHVQQIEKNNKVAIAVTDTHQTPKDKKKGVQIWGTAKRVTSIKKALWFVTQFTNDPSKYNVKEIVKSIGRVIYEITPTKIKFFNQELYEKDGGYKIIES